MAASCSGVAVAVPDARIACCALLASYLLNNVAQLSFASLVEKRRLPYGDERSLRLTPGLTEGTETVLAYVAFCLFPGSCRQVVAWVFAAMVLFTTGQRVALARPRTVTALVPVPPQTADRELDPDLRAHRRQLLDGRVDLDPLLRPPEDEPHVRPGVDGLRSRWPSAARVGGEPDVLRPYRERRRAVRSAHGHVRRRPAAGGRRARCRAAGSRMPKNRATAAESGRSNSSRARRVLHDRVPRASARPARRARPPRRGRG